MKVDICTCMIQLAGDARTIVARGPGNPLSYPAVNLMMHMHGERYITDVKVIDSVDRTNAEELENLRVKYGSAAVGEAFPGRAPRLPFIAPDDVPRDGAAPAREAPPENDGIFENSYVPAPEAAGEDGSVSTEASEPQKRKRRVAAGA